MLDFSLPFPTLYNKHLAFSIFFILILLQPRVSTRTPYDVPMENILASDGCVRDDTCDPFRRSDFTPDRLPNSYEDNYFSRECDRYQYNDICKILVKNLLGKTLDPCQNQRSPTLNNRGCKRVLSERVTVTPPPQTITKTKMLAVPIPVTSIMQVPVPVFVKETVPIIVSDSTSAAAPQTKTKTTTSSMCVASSNEPGCYQEFNQADPISNSLFSQDSAYGCQDNYNSWDSAMGNSACTPPANSSFQNRGPNIDTVYHPLLSTSILSTAYTSVPNNAQSDYNHDPRIENRTIQPPSDCNDMRSYTYGQEPVSCGGMVKTAYQSPNMQQQNVTRMAYPAGTSTVQNQSKSKKKKSHKKKTVVGEEIHMNCTCTVSSTGLQNCKCDKNKEGK